MRPLFMQGCLMYAVVSLSLIISDNHLSFQNLRQLSENMTSNDKNL